MNKSNIFTRVLLIAQTINAEWLTIWRSLQFCLILFLRFLSMIAFQRFLLKSSELAVESISFHAALASDFLLVEAQEKKWKTKLTRSVWIRFNSLELQLHTEKLSRRHAINSEDDVTKRCKKIPFLWTISFAIQCSKCARTRNCSREQTIRFAKKREKRRNKKKVSAKKLIRKQGSKILAGSRHLTNINTPPKRYIIERKSAECDEQKKNRTETKI